MSGDDGTDPPGDGAKIVRGVSFDELFAQPTESERQIVLQDWASRNPGAAEVSVVHDEIKVLAGLPARVRIVSHRVGTVLHFGAVITPGDLAPGSSLPVLVYTHGGDGGVDMDQEVFPILAILDASFTGDLVNEFVFVIPSYRSESIRFSGQTWVSDGPESPFDYDVDDVMALLSVAAQIEPAADLSTVVNVGVSRGAGVGLLMGIRDSRVDGIVEFFGPTDFFGPFIQDVVEETLLGRPPDLPSIDYLEDEVILPLQAGDLSIAEVRIELLRRSPAQFAALIPTLQAHHGTADAVVPVSQMEHLVDAMDAIGRGAPEFEGFIYTGGTHSPLSMPASLTRAAEFLAGFKK